MHTSLPRGVWPVMLTPFTTDNKIDYPALDALIEWYVENGVAGLFAVCQSSEMDYLNTAEKQALLTHIMQRLAGRLPVVAAGMPMDDYANYAAFCRDLGVTALVILPNRLVAEDDDENTCRDALQQLMELIPDMDLGLYECPQPYHRLLSAELVKRCAKSGRFVFMKETSCQRQQLKEKLAACQDSRLQLYPAHGPSVLFGLQHGASGCSNIGANVAPHLYAELCQNWQSEEAQELQNLLTLIDPHIRLGYPASAKRWLQHLGLPFTDHSRCAVPAVKADDELMRFDAVHHKIQQWSVKHAATI